MTCEDRGSFNYCTDECVLCRFSVA